MKTITTLFIGALAAASLLPVSAGAGVPRLAVVGQKDDDTVILLDMASRRNAEGGRIEADGVLVFPKAAPGFQLKSEGADAPPPAIPDKGHITVQFDCKARTITLVTLTLFNAEGEVTRTATPAPDPQTPVDPTDAHMLAYACGEAFPPTDKTFADEKAAIMAVRTKP